MKKLLALLLYLPLIGVNQNITINNSVNNSYNNQIFALVMSEGSGYGAQTWKTLSYFPEDAIKNGWDDGKRIIFISPGY